MKQMNQNYATWLEHIKLTPIQNHAESIKIQNVDITMTVFYRKNDSC